MAIDVENDFSQVDDDFSIPGVLIHHSYRKEITGIYDETPGGVSPLDGRTILPGTYFSCLATDVIGVGPGWYVDVKNQVLPVIAAIPDGMGRVELHLGDPE